MATPADPTAGFLEQLTAYGAMARDVLMERIPLHEPQGPLYAPMRDYIATSGKGLRPALMLSACKAFGGDPKDALTSAAVIELLHNAFLIHDDIEDISDFRRGRPCMHKRLGVPIAINTGDAMQALALRLLRQNVEDLGPETAARVLDEFDHLLLESIEGQAIELGWIRDNRLDVGPSDYLRMVMKKTCWYSFIHPVRIGALIAQPHAVASGDLDLSKFDAFGFFVGAAFQIQDDVLNLIGSEKKYGKEIGGDIYEGKRTLMLARLAGLAPASAQADLHRFLAKPRQDRSSGDVRWVHDLMNQYDCIPYAQKAAEDLLGAARREFESAFNGADPTEQAFLKSFMDYMVQRAV